MSIIWKLKKFTAADNRIVKAAHKGGQMKKIILSAVLIFIMTIFYASCKNSNPSSAETAAPPCWSTVGDSASGAEMTCLGVYNHVLYTAGYFEDSSNSYIFISKFNGTAWQQVSTYDITDTNKPWQVRMKIDQSNGDVYVAYEKQVSHYVGVLKYSTSTWSLLGGAEIYNGSPTMDIALDSSNVLYLATIDASGSNPVANVSKFSGTWSAVGSSFGGTGTNQPRIFVDSTTNTIYVSVIKNNLADTVRDAEVYVFNASTGPSWTLLGGASAASSVGLYEKPLYADSSGVYISLLGNDDNLIYIKKYSSGTWSFVGSGAVNSNPVFSPAEIAGNAGAIYVFYGDTDGTLTGQGTVKTVVSNSWQSVCSAGFTTGIIHNTHDILVDNSSLPAIIYTAYTSTSDYRAYIQKH